MINSAEYIKHVRRSESPNFSDINPRLLHGIIGCVTEVGEMMDAVKKTLFYNRTLDCDNLIEEIGDLLWYCALLCDEFGVTFEEIMDKNVAKLKQRYPEQFTKEDEQNRDYEAEKKAMKCGRMKDCFAVPQWKGCIQNCHLKHHCKNHVRYVPIQTPISQEEYTPDCLGHASIDNQSEEKCLGCLSRGLCIRKTLQEI